VTLDFLKYLGVSRVEDLPDYDKLSKNEDIDNQHKKWIEIINELHEALINENEFGNIIEESLEAMVEYTQVHFLSKKSI